MKPVDSDYHPSEYEDRCYRMHGRALGSEDMQSHLALVSLTRVDYCRTTTRFTMGHRQEGEGL